jgi:hypothetical protein
MTYLDDVEGRSYGDGSDGTGDGSDKVCEERSALPIRGRRDTYFATR